jgi:hypothetical protein
MALDGWQKIVKAVVLYCSRLVGIPAALSGTMVPGKLTVINGLLYLDGWRSDFYYEPVGGALIWLH